MGAIYSQLTPYERGQIDLLHRQHVSARQIALRINRSHRTVSREIQRNGEAEEYHAEVAEAKASLRQTERSRKRWKCTPQITEEISRRLSWDHSPDIIAGRCRREKIPMLSGEGIYQWIYAGAEQGGTEYTYLPSKRRKRKPRSRAHGLRGQIPNRVMITERDPSVDRRERIGDWEGDTIVGARGGSAMLTLVDRRSRMTLLTPLPDRTSASTTEAIILRLGSEVFNTLTLDNGKEFAGHLRVAKELKGGVYFCDPYSPWQRPSNENSNRMTRGYFPRGVDLSKLTTLEVERVEHILNNRPRKILGYATPWEIYSGKAQLPDGGAL